jgi:hypothetical protein
MTAANHKSMIAVDTVDAVEISEALEFLGQWLETTSPSVRADLDAFIGVDGSSIEVIADLRRLHRRLPGSVQQ